MKHYIVAFILLLFLATNSLAQAKPIKEIERDLHKSYSEIILANSEQYSEKQEKRLRSANELFEKTILQYTKNYPITLNYKFELLKRDFFIISSDDKKLRIYSWDTWMGGSMHIFSNVFQYKAANKIYAELGEDSERVEGTSFYSEIYLLKNKKKTYYLVIGNQVCSTSCAVQFVKIFTLNNKSLEEEKLIKTSTGITSVIAVPFDFFSVVDRPERPLKLIKYDRNKKILSIPVVFKNGKVTNKFINYQFDRQFFERI